MTASAIATAAATTELPRRDWKPTWIESALSDRTCMGVVRVAASSATAPYAILLRRAPWYGELCFRRAFYESWLI